MLSTEQEGAGGRRPSKYVHEMNSEERLQSLQEWAEGKKYVKPGDGGTMAVNAGVGLGSYGAGDPLATSQKAGNGSADKYGGQYEGPIGPPAYKTVTEEPQPQKKNAVKRWLDKRKDKKEAKRTGSAPPYVP